MLAEDIGSDWKSYDANMSTSIFYVEKELGVYVTDDYPLSKLNSQIRELKEYMEKETRERKKLNSKKGTIK